MSDYIPSEYVQIDRVSDARSSLEELSSCLDRCIDSDYAWKYAIISAHCALQGYLCIALNNGNSFQTWKDKQYRKWQKEYDKDSQGLQDLKIPQLDFFNSLYEKVFTSDTELDHDLIEFLNETRNGLVHFNTDSYSIERASIINSISESVKAIKKTPALAQGNFFYEEEDAQHFEKVTNEIEEKLQAIPNKLLKRKKKCWLCSFLANFNQRFCSS